MREICKNSFSKEVLKVEECDSLLLFAWGTILLLFAWGRYQLVNRMDRGLFGIALVVTMLTIECWGFSLGVSSSLEKRKRAKVKHSSHIDWAEIKVFIYAPLPIRSYKEIFCFPSPRVSLFESTLRKILFC